MKKIMWAIVFLLIMIVIVGVSTYFYRSYQQKSYLGSSDLSGSSASLIKRLSAHMILPSITPTIGTVTDITKLKAKSSFFKDAVNGNKVFIYPDKAIIYDEKADKIINVGAIPKATKEASGESVLK